MKPTTKTKEKQMNDNQKKYAEYLNYIKRNDPSRSPMSFDEFVSFYGLTADKPALAGIYSPINY